MSSIKCTMGATKYEDKRKYPREQLKYWENISVELETGELFKGHVKVILLNVSGLESKM